MGSNSQPTTSARMRSFVITFGMATLILALAPPGTHGFLGHLLSGSVEPIAGGCKSLDGLWYPPGASFSNDCNSCICGGGGNAGCTKMMCYDRQIMIRPRRH